MSKKKIHHRLSNAFAAWWFLYYHPKLQRRQRTQIDAAQAGTMEQAGFLITRDRGGQCWREFRHQTVPAITENLDIHYAQTDGKRVNADQRKNTHIECWLEFGPVEYGYLSDYPDPKTNWDMESLRLNYHDWKLDCGGSSFDAALIKLARLVRKHYGDYAVTTSGEARNKQCGKPVCGDCKDIRKWLESEKLFDKEK